MFDSSTQSAVFGQEKLQLQNYSVDISQQGAASIIKPLVPVCISEGALLALDCPGHRIGVHNKMKSAGVAVADARFDSQVSSMLHAADEPPGSEPVKFPLQYIDTDRPQRCDRICRNSTHLLIFQSMPWEADDRSAVRP